jgi:hypothetical protein
MYDCTLYADSDEQLIRKLDLILSPMMVLVFLVCYRLLNVYSTRPNKHA